LIKKKNAASDKTSPISLLGQGKGGGRERSFERKEKEEKRLKRKDPSRGTMQNSLGRHAGRRTRTEKEGWQQEKRVIEGKEKNRAIRWVSSGRKNHGGVSAENCDPWVPIFETGKLRGAMSYRLKKKTPMPSELSEYHEG